jgi:glycosyltransferase involved in cell wall biosynthesis
MITVAPAPPLAAPRLRGLSIVLPCYDEAANVERAIAEAAAVAERVADAHEVIVVDDGSRDETRALAEARAARDPRVRVLAHENNRGYGAALRTGFAAARLEWVFLTDADLQFDLGELADLAALTDDHDLVVGWRIARADPMHRRINAAAWNALVRHTCGVPVRDVDCAFKLMRREILQRLPLSAQGAVVSTELLVRAQLAGARITEVGVHHRPRTAGDASGASPRVILRAFGELRRLRAELRADEIAGPARPAARPSAA